MAMTRPTCFSLILLVAFYMPLSCFCAVANANGGDAQRSAPACHETAGADGHGSSEGSADHSNRGSCDPDSEDCECHCMVAHDQTRRDHEAVVTLAVPSPDETVAPLPLPETMRPVTLVEQDAPVWFAGERDRPRAHYAPTLLSLGSLLLN